MTKAKVVLITGASSGIGMGLARLFAKAGYSCVLMARRLDKCKDVADECLKLGAPEAIAYPCDVRDPDQCRDIIEQAIERLGRIDIFIGNAGVSNSSSGHFLKNEDYRTAFDTNFFGVVHCLDPLIPFLKQQGFGQIVGIGSLSSFRGLPQAGAYGSSKAALHHMLESLRLDLRSYGIGVSIIHPGFIDTPLTARNTFKMPFFMTLDKGCKKIFNAIQKRKPIYAFPFPLSFLSRVQILIPTWLRDRLLKNVRNSKRGTPTS